MVTVEIKLRPYQQECIDIIESKPPGAYLVQMATGCGKTATFSQIPRHGRVLILSHREELVRQPVKYYNCPVGIEMASDTSHGEDVVSASIMSMQNRFRKFSKLDFDTIIIDECHHSASKSYKNIINYFEPRHLIGFTATPVRGDGIRLDDVFDEIIFQRDLRWAIENGYLCNILCKRVHIGYDLTAVHTRNGDYAPGELDEAMEGTADAIAQAYREEAKGATLIFAVSVRHAEEIASKIPGAVVVTGKTKDRADIIRRFTNREIPVIVNVMVFTEGTDMPLVETVIIARPTQSDSLYTQMVGRGLRLHPDKEKLILIDCVGTTGRASLCTAPTLMGIDMQSIPEKKRDSVQGDLFELPVKAIAASDCPESWIRNVEIVDLFAKANKYNLHGVSYFKFPDGRLVCSLADNKRITIPAPDSLGNVVLGGQEVKYQVALDRAYKRLRDDFKDQEKLWNMTLVKKWGKQPPTESQLRVINRIFKDLDTSEINRMQAGMILNRVFNGRKK